MRNKRTEVTESQGMKYFRLDQEKLCQFKLQSNVMSFCEYVRLVWRVKSAMHSTCWNNLLWWDVEHMIRCVPLWSIFIFSSFLI